MQAVWCGASIGVRTVFFLDGVSSRCQVFLTSGPALVGQSTAFVLRDGVVVWVAPGESVDFMEVKERV